MGWKPAVVFERTVKHDRRHRVKAYSFLPKPKISFGKCGTCGKEIKNPLTHTCTVKTDFKRRRKAAAKKARKTRQPRKQAQSAHSYRTCRDPDCPRVACGAYRDGVQDGYDDGFEAGMRYMS